MRLRLIVFVLFALGALVSAPSVWAAPPTIDSPTAGEVEGGYTGPVVVTWNEVGAMKVVVTGPQPTQTIEDTVAAAPSIVQYTLLPLTVAGTYSITASKADGSDAASVELTVPPPNSAAVTW